MTVWLFGGGGSAGRRPQWRPAGRARARDLRRAWLHGLPATTDSFLRIKRNAQVPAKATDAAQIALSGDGVRSVSLDSAIRTMPVPGQDMKLNRKEVSRGGLAAAGRLAERCGDASRDGRGCGAIRRIRRPCGIGAGLLADWAGSVDLSHGGFGVARIPQSGDGECLASPALAIRTMRETGQDMKLNRKETSCGGLAAAVMIPVSALEC